MKPEFNHIGLPQQEMNSQSSRLRRIFHPNPHSYKERITSAPTPHLRALKIALVLLFIEYLFYLAFQLVSWFALEKFWGDSSWITGTVLIIVYILTVVGFFLVQPYISLWMRLAIKIFEFLLFFFIMGWGTGYGEFAVMSVSYMMLANIVLILFFLTCFKSITMWVIFIMMAFIVADAISKSFSISSWYYCFIMALYEAFRIFSLNLTIRYDLSVPLKIQNTFEFTIKLWIDFQLRNQTLTRIPQFPGFPAGFEQQAFQGVPQEQIRLPDFYSQ